jgi:hypothetical protein
VPKTVSVHATWAYSWTRPPNRSRRRTRLPAFSAGGWTLPTGGLALALVRDMREQRVPASAEEFAGFETDVLAGFVLARPRRAADSTIRNATGHLALMRDRQSHHSMW